jgi:hypothetical protein
MNLSELCRQRARICRSKAHSTTDEGARAMLDTAAYAWREAAREMELDAGRDLRSAPAVGKDEEDTAWLKAEIVNAWAKRLVRH